MQDDNFVLPLHNEPTAAFPSCDQSPVKAPQIGPSPRPAAALDQEMPSSATGGHASAETVASPSGRPKRGTGRISASSGMPPATNTNPTSGVGLASGVACLPSQISPQASNAVQNRRSSSVRGRVRVAVEGGQLLRVSRPDNRARGRGDRQEITRKTKRALGRLRDLLAQVDSRLRVLFVTLTYPGLIDFTEVQPGERHESKRQLDRFAKRLRRAYPRASAVWVADQKHRKSGASEGDLAPHYHLMVWGCTGPISEIRETIRRAWFEAVHGNEAARTRDVDHWRAGTSVEGGRSVGGLKGYLRSYCSKPKDEGFLRGFGQVWGAIGRSDLPMVEVRELATTSTGSARMVRAVRRYVEADARAVAKESGDWKRARRPRRYSIGIGVAVEEPEAWLRGFIRLGWIVDPDHAPPVYVVLGRPPPSPLALLSEREEEIKDRHCR